MSHSEAIDFFLDKDVTVKFDCYAVKGKLLHYQPSKHGRDHRPDALIIKTAQCNLVILRSWDLITTNQ
jgi:hypothetical protein